MPNIKNNGDVKSPKRTPKKPREVSYEVAQGTTAKELEIQVVMLLEKGYHLRGNLVVQHSMYKNVLYQVMTKGI